MADFTNRVKVLIETVADKSGITGFRTAVGEAEGFVGKLKAGAGSLATTLKNNLGTAALAGGTALIGFAVKSSEAFINLSKQALDLGRAIGTTTENASRWIAVGDDAGLTAEQLQAGMAKVVKTLDSPAWDKYGIAVRDAGGNLRDVSDITADALGAISALTTEQERAEAGTALFGKGWANLAPLVGHTADEYKRMLGAVSDGQVITEAEAAKAERLRLVEDRLGDALRDVALAFGEAAAQAAPLIDGVSWLAEHAADAASAFGPDDEGLSAGVKDFLKVAKSGKPSVAELGNALTDLSLTVDESRSVWDKGGEGVQAFFGELADNGELARVHLKNIKKAIGDVTAVAPEMGAVVADNLRSIALAADNGSTSAQDWLKWIGLSSDELRDYADGLAQATRNEEDQKAAIDASNAAFQEKIDLTKETIDTERAAIDSGYAYMNAVRDANKAVASMNETLGDSEASADDQADAIERARQAAVDASEAYVKQQGAALDSKAGIDLQIASLQAQADALAPGSPLRAQIEGYISDLKKIPTTVDTTITSTFVNRKLDEKSLDDALAGKSRKPTSKPTSNNDDGPRAGGGDVQANKQYGVVERNQPEVFTDRAGRKHLIGADGTITPLREGGGAGTQQHYHDNRVINVQNATPETAFAVINRYDRWGWNLGYRP